MNKTALSSAIAVCLGVATTQAFAVDAPITNMKFGAENYAAQGTLSNASDAFSHIESVDNFFSNPWAAAGVAYFEPGVVPTEDLDLSTDEGNVTNGTVPTIFDDPGLNGTFSQTLTDNGPNPDDGAATDYTWSGNADQLPAGGGTDFTYDFTLQPNEVAWGTLFNWNGSAGIPVLVIVDCLTNPGVACVGRGTPMVTQPFPGSAPKFSSGPKPLACEDKFTSTEPDVPVVIKKSDLLIGCKGGQGVPAVSSVDATSVEGGTVDDDGTSLTFTPMAGFEGADSFGYTIADELFTADQKQDVQVGGDLTGNFTIMKADGGTFGGANDVVFEWDQVTFNTDESDNDFNIIKISANTPFFGVNWTAHHIRVYQGPATLSFDTTCTVAQLEAGTSDCGGPPERMMDLTIPAGMYGAHINFDWNGNTNIDVVNVWEPNGMWDDPDGTDLTSANNLYQGAQGVLPSRESLWELASKDVNGDGINGSPMLQGDGPFPGNYANFSWMPDTEFQGCEVELGLDEDADGNCVNGSEISDVDTPTLSLGLWGLLAGFMTLLGFRKIKNNK